MVPALERAAFVVIQTKLTLGVLIDALGPPPFLHPAHDLPPSHGLPLIVLGLRAFWRGSRPRRRNRRAGQG